MNSNAFDLIRVCLKSSGLYHFDDRITMPQHSLCLTCNLCGHVVQTSLNFLTYWRDKKASALHR